MTNHPNRFDPPTHCPPNPPPPHPPTTTTTTTKDTQQFIKLVS